MWRYTNRRVWGLYEIIEAVFYISLIAYFGYKLLSGIRTSRKFNRDWNSLQDSDKQAFLNKKGRLSDWELGSFTKLPMPIAFIGNLVALAVILLFVVVVVAIILK